MKKHAMIDGSCTRCLLAMLLCFVPAVPGFAADDQAYVIEMVVFERPGGGMEEFWPEDSGAPDRELAARLLGQDASVPADQRELGPVAFTLQRRGMVVHKHVAWQEVPAARNSGAWQWLETGRLSGLVKLTRGRFLHLDTDLLLRDDAAAQTYRVRLNRKMRSDELHYVDHPKIGIVIQAKRVEEAASPDAGDPAAGEPQPATPELPAPTAG